MIKVYIHPQGELAARIADGFKRYPQGFGLGGQIYHRDEEGIFVTTSSMTSPGVILIPSVDPLGRGEYEVTRVELDGVLAGPEVQIPDSAGNPSGQILGPQDTPVEIELKFVIDKDGVSMLHVKIIAPTLRGAACAWYKLAKEWPEAALLRIAQLQSSL